MTTTEPASHPAQSGPAWAAQSASASMPSGLPWIVIAVVGAVLCGIAFLYHPIGDYFTETDFYGSYVDGALMIQRGHVDPARYPVVGPVYEMALALAGAVIPDLFTAARLISIASACVVLALWYVLLARRVGVAVGLWATAMLAVNPIFLRYGYSATTDMLSTVLQAGSVFALLAASGPAAPVVAGALAALATLTRYNALYLVPTAVVCYLAFSRANLGVTKWRALLLYAAGFLVVAGPWIAFSLQSGYIPGGSLYRNFGFYMTKGFDRNVQDALITAAPPESVSFGRLVQRHPTALIGSALVNAPQHLMRDARELIGWPLAVLALVGLLVAIRDGRWRTLIPVWTVGAFGFAVLVPVFYSDRYSLPLAPVYLSAAAVTIATLHANSRTGRPWMPPGWLLGTALVAGLIPAAVSYQREVRAKLPLEILPASRALAASAPPGSRVMSRKAHVGYYAGVDVVPFPRLGTLPDLGRYCRERGVGFLYFSGIEAILRPEFAYMLDTSTAVPGLTALYATPYEVSPPAVLYRVDSRFGEEPDWFANNATREVRFARALVRVEPDSVATRHWIVLGRDALEHGRGAAALAAAEVVVQDRPELAQGWLLKGSALQLMDRRVEAAAAFRRAAAIDPSLVRATSRE